jgi:hypothetical protein
MELTKFQETLSVFAAIKNNIENDLKVIKRYINDDDLKFSLTNKMLIDIVSFLSEWKRVNTYVKDDEEIKETMSITSNIIKRVKKWRGIEGMRNTILAHGFRDTNNNDKLTCLDKKYFNADVPTNYAEIMLLSELIVYVIATFICRHKADSDKCNEFHKSKEYNSESKGIITMEEFNKEISFYISELYKNKPELKECFKI